MSTLHNILECIRFHSSCIYHLRFGNNLVDNYWHFLRFANFVIGSVRHIHSRPFPIFTELFSAFILKTPSKLPAESWDWVQPILTSPRYSILSLTTSTAKRYVFFSISHFLFSYRLYIYCSTVRLKHYDMFFYHKLSRRYCSHYFLYQQNLGIWLATEPGVNNTFHVTVIYTRLYQV
jgi:hypothetical protein